MQPKPKTDREPAPGPAGRAGQGTQTAGFSGPDAFALVFGLFLGLALLKFGNPVILDSKISAPKTFPELWTSAWPPRWSVGFLLPLLAAGGGLVFIRKARWPAGTLWWVLPLVWLGWQGVSATQTVDGALTSITLWQFAGCVGGYLLGAFLFGSDRLLRLLLVGVLAGFAICLVRAVDQKWIGFPAEKTFLLEGERRGWTNLPPEVFWEMKHSQAIITTNGVDVANPILVRKFTQGRVFGTLVYPNALAGLILLLFPLSLVLALTATRPFRALTRFAVIGLAAFLGLGGLYWTGSKSGWLIALVLGGVWLFRLNWPLRAKGAVLLILLILGLGAFGIRFRGYFASGATSVGARFDYWRAAVQTTIANPVLGTGPGTFQRPYERIKAPEAEMARLAHNDYLEQFSDSGLPGGVSYLLWLGGLLALLGRRLWKGAGPFHFAIFLGLLGWFLQGFSEFGLYVPALAWTAFTLAGALLGLAANPFDKAAPRR